MHELSIAENIIDTVLERTRDQRVTTIRVRVGKLAGVVPDALTFCFDLAAQGTALEGSRLEILEQDARGHCRDCGTDFTLPDLFLLCPCGSADVEVLAGRDLAVASVEMA